MNQPDESEKTIGWATFTDPTRDSINSQLDKLNQLTGDGDRFEISEIMRWFERYGIIVGWNPYVKQYWIERL